MLVYHFRGGEGRFDKITKMSQSKKNNKKTELNKFLNQKCPPFLSDENMLTLV